MADFDQDIEEQIRKMSDAALEHERRLQRHYRTLEDATEKTAQAMHDHGRDSEQYANALRREERVRRDLSEAEDEAFKATSKLYKGFETLKNAGKDLGKELISITGSMGKGNTELDVFNGLIKTAGKIIGGVLGQIPVVGGAFEGMAEGAADAAVYLVDQLNATYKAFQDISRVGATAGDGMQNIVDQFSALKLPLGEYTKIITENTQAMASLGATTQDSITSIVTTAGAMKASGIDQKFRMLGYSSTEITESMIEYADLQRRMGFTDVMTQQKLQKSTGQYLLELDAIAKITGMNRKEAEAEMKSRMGDDRFRAMLSSLDADLATKINSTLTILGKHDKEMATGLGHLMTGFAGSEEALKVLRSLGGEAQQAAIAFKNGRMSQEDFVKVIQKTSGEYTQRMGGLAEAVGTPEGFLDFSDQMDLTTEKFGNLGKAIAEITKQQKEQLALADKGQKTTTAVLNKAKTDIEATSAAINELTAKSHIMATAVGKTAEAMNGFASWVNKEFGGSGGDGYSTVEQRQSSNETLQVLKNSKSEIVGAMKLLEESGKTDTEEYKRMQASLTEISADIGRFTKAINRMNLNSFEAGKYADYAVENISDTGRKALDESNLSHLDANKASATKTTKTAGPTAKSTLIQPAHKLEKITKQYTSDSIKILEVQKESIEQRISLIEKMQKAPGVNDAAMKNYERTIAELKKAFNVMNDRLDDIKKASQKTATNTAN